MNKTSICVVLKYLSLRFLRDFTNLTLKYCLPFEQISIIYEKRFSNTPNEKEFDTILSMLPGFYLKWRRYIWKLANIFTDSGVGEGKNGERLNIHSSIPLFIFFSHQNHFSCLSVSAIREERVIFEQPHT